MSGEFKYIAKMISWYYDMSIGIDRPRPTKNGRTSKTTREVRKGTQG